MSKKPFVTKEQVEEIVKTFKSLPNPKSAILITPEIMNMLFAIYSF